MTDTAPIIDIQRGRRAHRPLGTAKPETIIASYDQLCRQYERENEALVEQAIRQAEQLGRLALIIADLRAQLGARS